MNTSSNLLKDIIYIIKNNYPLRFLLIFLAGNFIAFLEILSLASIPVFVGIILSPESFMSYIPFDELRVYLTNLTSNYNFVAILCGLVFTIFLVKNLFLSILILFEFRTIHKIKKDLTTKIFNYYIIAPYEKTINVNPSHLSRNILIEIGNAVSVILLSMNFVREILFVIFAIIFLLIQNPYLSSLIIFSFMLAILIFFLLIKKIITKKAIENIEIRDKLVRNVNEIFGSLKNIKIMLLENSIIKDFKEKVYIHENNQFILNFFNKLPKILLELVSLATIFFLIIFLIQSGKDKSIIISLMTLVTVLIIRLIPSFNTISICLNNFKTKGPSLSLINEEIKKIRKIKDYFLSNPQNEPVNLTNFMRLRIKNLTFSFPNTKKTIFENLSFDIKKGDLIGIVGKTGSGKSTFINLITGLLKPQEGKIDFNEKNIFENISLWRNQIGYVPQDIFLNDDTIKNNIVFGDDLGKINQHNLDEAIKISKLGSFLSSLKKGLETNVGRDGIKISGGQKQRIAIARAIYKNPNILILDEATSALDPNTENEILNNIKKIFKKRGSVIFISHKIKILHDFDYVYQLNEKKLSIVKI